MVQCTGLHREKNLLAHCADQVNPDQWVNSFGGLGLNQMSCSDMRRMIVDGLRDELTWQQHDKAAMAQTLLVDSHLDFWAQIGFLLKVCSFPLHQA
jgi:hypothetical protein